MTQKACDHKLQAVLRQVPANRMRPRPMSADPIVSRTASLLNWFAEDRVY
jgi:hypothetical protein